MLIRFRTTCCSPLGAFYAGQIGEIPEVDAKPLIAAGYARQLDQQGRFVGDCPAWPATMSRQEIDDGKASEAGKLKGAPHGR